MLGGAGKIVPLAANGRADVPALAAAMEEMLDAGRRADFSAAAPQAGAAFSMERCVSRYEALFQELLTRREEVCS
jgi:glycosyltransferase involved in cell wall biosynthesis